MMFVFLCSICFGFGFVNCSIRMIWGRINCVQLHLFGLGSIDNIMESTSRHNHGIIGFYIVNFCVVEDKFGFPIFNAKKLVDIFVDFVANLFAWL